MSRFACDDYDPDFQNQGELFWANAARSLKGRKGQAALRELRDELLAMPEPKLIRGRLADEQGHVCAVGALAVARRCAKGERREDVLDDLAAKIAAGDGDESYDGWDITAAVGVSVGVPFVFAYALGDLNDESLYSKTPEERHTAVLAWIDKQLTSGPTSEEQGPGVDE